MLTPSILRAAAFSFALLAAAAHAQQGDDDERGVTGKAALGYLATSGNTNNTNASGAFNLIYALPVWRHDFDLTAVNASANEQTTAEAYTADYEGRRALGERSYIFTALDWRRDRFSAFREQVSETVGYGRRLLERERHVLDVGVGAGLRQSRRIDGTRERDGIARGYAEYIWMIAETSEFSQKLVTESGSSNTMVEAVSALRTRLVGNIGLVLSYRLRRNSQVPDGIQPTDRFTSIALEYAF